MGAVKRAVSSVFGGSRPKPAPVVAAAPEPVEPSKSASEIAEEEDKKKKAAIVAANAGNSSQMSLGSPGETNVSRRNLLGL